MEKSNPLKQIIHFDMDAFYPSVEILDHPELKGKPVLVGGGGNRGVVSSASYEARKFGVHSAQPMVTALRLCPDAIVMPVRMLRYQEISQQVFDLFFRFTPLVEPLSIDEAFIDVTGSIRLFGDPVVIAKTIKALVVKETGLTISAGVAPSKFLAKIASDLEKPDGLTVVPHDGVQDFLDPLPIKMMWGVGKVTQAALKQLNVATFKDLREMPADLLKIKFGKNGHRMHRLSMGIDNREVITSHKIKSIGHELTFSLDILDKTRGKRELLALSNRVASRMRRHGVRGKTITLKVKYYDFVQITRSATSLNQTDDRSEIYSAVCRLLDKTLVGKKPVRLLGVSLSQLSHPGSGTQLHLFGPNDTSSKKKDLNQALDSVNHKFGDKSILPGTLIQDPVETESPLFPGKPPVAGKD